jgi:protein phosphatase 1K
MTKPHKPEGREMERIVNAGGCVTYDSLGNARVNGRLEMSRSLGDVELKGAGVISEPDITALNVSDTDCITLNISLSFYSFITKIASMIELNFDYQ